MGLPKGYPEFIKCYACRKVSTKEDISRVGKCGCGGHKFLETLPSLANELTYLVWHPSKIKFVLGDLWKSLQ